ncbi:MAG: hypothetical protein U0326_33540 [Polyangiales bacterium]
MRSALLVTSFALCASTVSASSSAVAQASPSPPSSSSSAWTPPPPTVVTEPQRLNFDGLPTLRFGFGFGRGAPRTGDAETDFAFDLAAGAWLLFSPRETGVQLWPEIGYASDSSDVRGGRYATAGVGLMYGAELFSAGVAPRFLIGDADGRLGLGLRSSLVVQAGYTAFSLEAGHQWMRVGGEDLHEFRATLSVNPISLLFLVFTVAGGSIFRAGASAAGSAVGIH